MTQDDTRLIDISALDNRMRQLSLKRWWVAEQIGVDRKTVTRWLTGQTRKIRHHNLERLSALLGCQPSALTVPQNNYPMASETEQGFAAKLIEQENLLEILTPGGQWPLLEELIKVSLRPALPLPLLGQLYNYLAIAAWRQSHLAEAESYASRALDIGRQTNNKAVLARAMLNEATLLSFRGRVKEALASYHYCLDQHTYLDDDTVYGSALSNLGMTYWQYGDFEKSLAYQEQAIETFTHLQKHVNLSIAWIAHAATHATMQKWDESWMGIEKALHHSQVGSWRRGFADAHLVAVKIMENRRDVAAAAHHFELANARFNEMNIHESRTEVTRAIIARLKGQLTAAKTILEAAESMHPEFLISRTETFREWLNLANAMGDRRLFEQKKAGLIDIYETCGCDGWLAQLGR